MPTSIVGGQLEFEFDRTLLQLMTPDEIFDRADEQLLRDLFEDSRFEAKPSGIHARELGEWFSMWANTAPHGGLIVVGIKNDDEFEGCSRLSPNQLNEIEATADTYCPDAINAVRRVLIHRDDDGAPDFVLLFRVHYHRNKVVRTSGQKAYIRRADRKKELRSSEELRELQAEKGEVRFEAEPCGLEYPKDFDKAAVADYAAAVRTKREWDESHSTEEILHLMHLGSLEGEKFTPNFACALLFARDPRTVVPGCRIRFLRFEGETEGQGDKWNAVKDEFIEGTVPQLIGKIETVLRSQLRTFSQLGPGGKFVTAKEYPEFAWYEAVVNACAHRSYGNGLKNTPIFVKMFDDRLVVESPGAFPAFVTPSNIYEVQHTPRNPFLMDGMFYLKYVKCAREGTRRMRAEMLESELPPPEFRQEEVGKALVRVTLRNGKQQRKQWVDADAVAVLGAQQAALLSTEEKRCVNFCVENGKITVSDAQRVIDGDWRTMKKRLEGLVRKGILEHVHRKDILRDPKAHYVLKMPPPPKT